MASPRPMRFLASVPNDRSHGGIYLCDWNSRSVERIFSSQAMGIVTWESCLIIGCESLSSASQPDLNPPHWPNSVVVLDRDFNVVSELEVAALGMGDLHELHLRQDLLYVVDTLGNRVVEFQISNDTGEGAVGRRPHFLPRRQWIDPHALEKDACHVNGVTLHQGHILASTFGPFGRFREYATRGATGHVWDITASFLDFGINATAPIPPAVAVGLADPHSLTSSQGRLYLAESRRSQILCDGEVLFRASEGYLRGILCHERSLWIGSSASRHSPSQRQHASILMIDLDTGQKIDELILPTREVFSLVHVDGDL